MHCLFQSSGQSGSHPDKPNPFLFPDTQKVFSSEIGSVKQNNSATQPLIDLARMEELAEEVQRLNSEKTDLQTRLDSEVVCREKAEKELTISKNHAKHLSNLCSQHKSLLDIKLTEVETLKGILN